MKIQKILNTKVDIHGVEKKVKDILISLTSKEIIILFKQALNEILQTKGLSTLKCQYKVHCKNRR